MAEETKTTVETTTNATENQSKTPTVEELMAQLAAERARADKNKLELDKALKETGDVKKALRAKQTAEEAEAEAKAEAERVKDARIAELEKQVNYSNAVSAYREISDEKAVAKLIEAVSNADHKGIAQIIANECKAAVANAQVEWLENRPPVNSGTSGGAMTKKDIMAIQDTTERQKAISEHMNLFYGGN